MRSIVSVLTTTESSKITCWSARFAVIAFIVRAGQSMQFESAFPNDDFTHATEDGDIRVWIEPHINGWAARIKGGELDSIQVVRTGEKAICLGIKLLLPGIS